MKRLMSLLLLFVLSFALAQTGAETLPLIRLSDFTVAVGEDLVLNASDLDPNTQYELSLTSPEGEESVEVLEADSEGNLDYTVQFDEAGRWQLGLSDLNFTVPIQVQAALNPATSENNSENNTDENSTDESSTDESNTEAQADADNADEAAEESAALQEDQDSETPDETAQNELDESSESAETPILTPVPDEGTEAGETGETPLAEAQEDEAASETPATPSQDPETVPNTGADTSRRGPLSSLALALGRSGWYGVAALLFAIAALHVVLIAKYWLAQTVNLERRRILGRSVAVWSRALAMRYYDLTEKLVVLLLFVAVMVMAALAAWSTPGVHPESWNEAVVRVFQNPWNGLLNLRPGGVSNILWMILVILFLLAVLITVIWLFVPRLRWVGNAPRNAIYHLLALLVPGSGLADEMWGLLLIIPWALFGLDALIDVMGWGFGLGLSLFWDVIIVVAIYLINLVAVIIEYLSYRRRMTTLKRDNPELAQEFGLLSSIK